jgi:hypothetical protein
MIQIAVALFVYFAGSPFAFAGRSMTPRAWVISRRRAL